MGKSIGAAILFLSLACTAYGLINSNILSVNPWPIGFQQDALLFVGIFLTLLGGAWFLERRKLFPFASGIFFLLLAESFFFFGTAALPVFSFMLASWILGELLRKATRAPPARSPLPSLLLGMAILTVLLNWCSVATLNTLPLHLAARALIFLAGIIWLRKELRELLLSLPSLLTAPAISCNCVTALLLSALALTFGLLIAIASGPELTYDALATHLYIPSFMSGLGYWDFSPLHHSQSKMPAAVDFLYAHFYLIGGETSARFFNVAALGVAGATLFRMMRAFASTEGALVALLLVFSTPLTALESSTLFVENALLLWISGAAYFLLAKFPSTPAYRWMGYSALAAAAVASKLHGVVALPFLVGIALVEYPPRTVKAAFTYAAILAVFLALGSFPYYWAFHQTGNPVFPYYNDIFLSPSFPAIRFVDIRWTDHLQWQMLYDFTFHSEKYLEGIAGAAGLTWILFLPAACFTALYARNRIAILCVVAGLGACLLSAKTLQYLRYFYPFLGFLAAVLAAGFDRWTSAGLNSRKILLSLVAITVVGNWYLLPTSGPDFFFNIVPFFQAEKREKLELKYAPEKLANRFINSLGLANPRVLYPEEPRGGGLRGTALYTNWLSQYYRLNGRRVVDALHAEQYLRLIGANFVVQPVQASTKFSKAMALYLEKSAIRLGEFGNVELFAMPPPTIAP